MAGNSVRSVICGSVLTQTSGAAALLPRLKPLNLYGQSKNLFDAWALAAETRGEKPPSWSGFKFFNVSGFGRRSASFMALKTLRPDYVKVDGVIVRKLLSAPASEAKLKAILRVGEVMGFQVIAEMVEEQAIFSRLKTLGVGYAQGFGIQQPHPIEKLARN